jgi:purine-binding chemotaxis protein CheW
MGADIIPIDQVRSRQLAVQEKQQYVTMRLGGQLFGLPVLSVQDVLKEQHITPIPLAASEIAGALNLRGRIVTVVDMRRRLGIDTTGAQKKAMQVVVEHGGELYSLLVDEVGDVMLLSRSDYESNPSNLSPQWLRLARGVFRLEGEIMVLLDVDSVLSIGA